MLERPPLWRRALDALAPYFLLAVIAGLCLAGYRVTFRSGPPLWMEPRALWLLCGLPIVAVFHLHLRRRRAAAMLFSRTRELSLSATHWPRLLRRLPQVLRLAALALLILALARPQRDAGGSLEVEGIDIVLALDVSNSMSERDLAPDRLTSAKEVLKGFIGRRRSDRVGLVIFGREAFTQCPLTLDYRALGHLLDDVRLGLIDGRGTAIGNALGTAINRLRRSDARSRVVILLTDGDNNAGNLSPEQAARYAQTLGVKVFTILMGRDVDQAGGDDPAVATPRPTTRYPVNPRLLERIAQETGGTPYLATDTPALEKRFQAILDELDRTRIREQHVRREELYPLFLHPALALLLLELALALTRFRRFP